MDPSSSSKQSSATEIREMTERKLQVTETAPTEATEHLPEDITPTKQLLAQAKIPMVDKPLEQRLRRKKQPTEVTLTQSITPPTKSSVDALKAKLGSDFFKPYPEVLFALSTGAISHTGKTKKGGAPVFRLNLNDNTNYEWLFTPLGGPTYLESVCHKNCKPYPPYENGVYSDFMHMMWQRYNFIFGTNRGREIIAEWLTGEPRDTNESKAKKEMTTLMQNPTHPAPPLFHEAKQKLEKSKKLDQKENAIVTQEQSLIFPPCDHLKNPRTPMDHKVKMALIALPELSTLYKNETLKYSGYPDPIGRPVFHFTNLPEMSFVCSQNGPAESIANYKDKFLCSTFAEAIELKKKL